jgi:hypothetical protein
MRQGPNLKRSRGRNNNNNNNNNNQRRPNMPLRMQTFDSNGPDVRIRGSAFQVHEKYLQLARDANSSGDRIMAESYLQHAEHYYRIIAAAQEQQNQQNGGDTNRSQRSEGGYGQDYRAQGGENSGGEGEGPGEGNRTDNAFRPQQQDPSSRPQAEGQYRERGTADGGNYRQQSDRQPADRSRGERQPAEGNFRSDRDMQYRAAGEGSYRQDSDDTARPEEIRRPRQFDERQEVHSQEQPVAPHADGHSDGVIVSEPVVLAQAEIPETVGVETSSAPRRGRPRRERPSDQEALAIPEPAAEG